MIEIGARCFHNAGNFRATSRHGQLKAFDSSDYWRDIGTPRSYLTASNDVMGGTVGRGDDLKHLSVDRSVTSVKTSVYCRRYRSRKGAIEGLALRSVVALPWARNP